MAGPVTAGVLLVKKYFADYQAQIVRLLKRKRPLANNSDDASTIGTYDYTGLLKPARDALATHAARRDNPHAETMDTIGSYTGTEITAKLGAKVPNSIVPVSSYGLMDGLSDAQMAGLWTASGYVLTMSKAIKAVLSGTPYVLPAGTINLSAVDSAPANKTFYIYVRSELGVVSYQARTDTPPESVSIMFIGTATTGASGITSYSFVTVTRIDTFRLSQLPIGSAIPVAAGNYDSLTPFPTTWNPQ
jgi:hypothetical protein